MSRSNSSLNAKILQIKVAEKIKTHILRSITLFFSVNRAVYEINVGKHCRVGQAKSYNITQRMRIACCIPKATNTHSDYVISIFSPLYERTRLNVTLYVRCLSCSVYICTTTSDMGLNLSGQ